MFISLRITTFCGTVPESVWMVYQNLRTKPGDNTLSWFNKKTYRLGTKASDQRRDHYNLIIDFQILDNEQDRQMVEKLVKRLLEYYDIKSWSFDKGYWTKENKELLSKHVSQVIMPKLGKRNKQ